MVTLANTEKTTLIDALASIGTTTESALSTAYDTSTYIKGSTSVQVSLTFNASATVGCSLYVYGSEDGTIYDSSPREIKDIALKSGASVQSFDVSDRPRYLKFSVYNKGPTYTVTGITVTAQSQTVS